MKFLFSRHGGNNIFIDDINIDIATATKDISETIELMSIYPNPTSNLCSIKFKLSQSKTLLVNIFNVLGEKVYNIQKNIFSEGENELKLNTSNLSNGIYIIELSDGLRAINKQLIISK